MMRDEDRRATWSREERRQSSWVALNLGIHLWFGWSQWSRIRGGQRPEEPAWPLYPLVLAYQLESLLQPGQH